MRRLLLDTTFLIDTERVAQGRAAALDDADDTAIAAVTVAELLLGVELASDRHRDARRAFVDDVIATIPILPYDVRVAVAHAGLLASVRRIGRPHGAHDLIIAATAMASDRTVLTPTFMGFSTCRDSTS